MAGRRGGLSKDGGPGAPGGGRRERARQSGAHASDRSETGRGLGHSDAESALADADRVPSGARSGRGGNSAAAEADPEAIARQICLRMLSAAPRTQAELAAALRRRGVPDAAAEAVLARFAEVKLIDDELFARAWVESRHHGRGLAGRALGQELRQRGVPSAEIEAALGELSPEQELATARELVERRLSGTAGLPPLARVRRLTNVLARKGYSAGLAYRVVREALERESAAGSVPSYDLEFPEPYEEEEPAEAQ